MSDQLADPQKQAMLDLIFGVVAPPQPVFPVVSIRQLPRLAEDGSLDPNTDDTNDVNRDARIIKAAEEPLSLLPGETYAPTSHDRYIVRQLVKVPGLSNEYIARMFGITETSLRRIFRDELYLRPNSHWSVPGGVYQPTEEHRRLVEEMAAIGTPEGEIARLLVPGGMSVGTLKHYFAEELATAKTKMVHKAGKKLMTLVESGEDKVAADLVKYVLTRKGGFEAPVQKLETGPAGAFQAVRDKETAFRELEEECDRLGLAPGTATAFVRILGDRARRADSGQPLRIREVGLGSGGGEAVR